VRDAHPCRGGRKIRAVLAREEGATAPAAGTITAIPRRHGRVALADSLRRQPRWRFERAAPDELWQMDLKGHLPCRGAAATRSPPSTTTPATPCRLMPAPTSRVPPCGRA
jgi:hypothetical protein